MENMNSIQRELIHLKDVVAWTSDQLLRPFSGAEDEQVANGCLDLVIEHGGGICILADSEHFGPMFALLRVAYEALIRGLWLASYPEEFHKFKYDKMNFKYGTNFKELVKKVERKFEKENTVLSTFSEQAWGIMNDFTHTGYQHIVRRYKNNVISGNYPADEIRKALSITAVFVLLAGASLATRYNDVLLSDKFIKKCAITRSGKYFDH